MEQQQKLNTGYISQFQTFLFRSAVASYVFIFPSLKFTFERPCERSHHRTLTLSQINGKHQNSNQINLTAWSDISLILNQQSDFEKGGNGFIQKKDNWI